MQTNNTNPMPITEGSFGFSKIGRFKFYATYVFAKFILFWRDVKRPRIRLFAYEVSYSLCRAARRPPLRLRWLRLKHVTTTFGTFNIRPGTTDAATVSPAFERSDLNRLLAILEKRLSAGRTVPFIDVGADVGTYAISIANRLHHLGEIHVLAFEPSSSSYELLLKNVADNNLTGIVEARQVALGDGSTATATLRFDPREPGGSELNAPLRHGELGEEVTMSTIDAHVNTSTLADVVALKLDVEGSEASVLRGATATLAAAQEVLLLAEDFIDPTVVSYLEKSSWSFQGKLTPYNSFWTISN
jgi:FkbM family methyltransferase